VRYNINFEDKKVTDSEIRIQIVEEVTQNEALGDYIGICKRDNILWIMRDYIDIEDIEVREWLRTYFL